MSDTNRTDAVEQALGGAKALGDAARQIGGQAAHAGQDALEQGKSVAAEAKERAASLLGVAGEKASAVADEQRQNVASYIDDVAHAIHRSGEQLEGHQDWVAHMVERGAAELEVLANTLRTNDVQSLMGSLGSLARRQPALFVGASMAAGFALARVGRLAAAGASTPSAPATHGTAETAPVNHER